MNKSARSRKESAIRAARLGGEILLDKFREGPRTIVRKGSRDYVTDADRESQKVIVEFLRKRHPGDAICAEESLKIGNQDGLLWVIDPLDGTTNFIHGYPCFSVSVAILQGSRILAGAIYDPTRGEMFDAELGAGSRLNGKPIRASTRTDLPEALLVTGFPFRNPDGLDEFLLDFTGLFRACSGIRRDGSAALNLCYIASGRLDGFWERGLSLWDIAAGTLLVQEAGGKVSDLRGTNTHLDTGEILAANPEIHRRMLAILKRNPLRGELENAKKTR
ncbi:MAG: inositol monophosphatase family protein [Acidobacteria bacterium]|nr:inositol monophosphatase family protein [Acidobacteriota bacterium]